ncbi:MAG: phosphoribosyl-ATP diphosphatase [Alphaproteobacteria bacterium]|nr:phosphoribosyl-ATP diphosphatase [Alphaproteobacteria bacterium]
MMDTLETLYAVIESRKGGDVEASYVAKLLSRGTTHIAQKVGEEALETALAASSEGREKVVYESADLLFHLLVLWADQGIRPADVAAELARREGTSGIAEKNARK